MKAAVSINDYMKDYDSTFSKDLDTLWDGIDTKKNGYMDS
jgi:hypothetical protein